MIPSADSHFLELCRRLMQQPAIAYHEENIIQEVEQICREAGLDFVVDAYGNRIVTLATAPERAPIALVAHMDHPGFEVIHKRSDTVLEARFLGGVGPSYFKPGVPLRVYPGGLAATLGGKLPGEEHFEIVLNTALSAVTPEFAVWDLVPHEVTADQIRGRACDDLIGVATILETLCRLKESGAAVHVKGLITRAEEVGFHGSLLLAESGMISKESWVISLETSRELPPVLMGRGAILRVGDRASVFDSRFTRALSEVAVSIQNTDPTYSVQRALMSGGTCEGTAFQEQGYRVAALCVALGHYHNCGPDSEIREEFVSTSDALGMVRLLVEAAPRLPEFDTLANKLGLRLAGYRDEARLRLSPPSLG